ncbi:Txe/YoeB family addiction module toxin [Sediminispirochaeta bajacaliforniensis]|uniref:Txe/YoeB family addiction module toxin n=1 Tax=Sediminispirochaeta bajacaliforniensis TaxID=148 RepID=UPI0003825752|nr:Txe/YoeB family addiction module toxin [Sediminispirochaeta bajacaliforniensis]
MNWLFTPESWEDYLYWQKNDKKLLRRINELIKDIQRNPFEGMGKTEPLKYQLQGCWSRRIDQAHRLIYEMENELIKIIACRFHY